MKLGKLFKAVIQTATLPIAVAIDVIGIIPDAGENKKPFQRTANTIENIADDLDEFTE